MDLGRHYIIVFLAIALSSVACKGTTADSAVCKPRICGADAYQDPKTCDCQCAVAGCEEPLPGEILGSFTLDDTGADQGHSPSAFCYGDGVAEPYQVAIAYQYRPIVQSERLHEVRVVKATASFPDQITDIQTVATASSDADQIGRYIGLGVLSQANAHHMVIGYSADDAKDLMVAQQTTTGWNNARVDNQGNVGDFLDVAIDHLDGAHMSYVDSSSGRLKYMLWADGDVLQVPVVVDDASSPVGSIQFKSAIATDSQGDPYMSYYDGDNGHLRVARVNRETRAWEIIAVGRGVADEILRPDASGFARLRFDMIPRPNQIAIRKQGQLLTEDEYQVRGVTGVVIEKYKSDPDIEYTVDYVRPYNRKYGQWSSIGLDFRDRVHVVFFDGHLEQLVHASSADPFGGEPWEFTVVDSYAPSGDFPDFKIATYQVDGIETDVPMVSYHDKRRADLMFAYRIRGTWRIGRIGTLGWTGLESSLAPCADGSVMIATRTFDTQHLRNRLDVHRVLPGVHEDR